MKEREPVTVVVVAWERPIYLWVTLDSLYRHTPDNARFVVLDNGSRDPMVRAVIEGFHRRGMLSHVEYGAENDPRRLSNFLAEQRTALGEYFAIVDGDVEVLPGVVSWLSAMTRLMDDNRRLGFLGSLIDARDFVSPERARDLAAGMSDDVLEELAKLNSPERTYSASSTEELDTTLAPPGRLSMVRSVLLEETPFLRDAQFTRDVTGRGWLAGVAMRVRHRHLSLLHLFDHPDYDTAARNEYFGQLIARGGAVAGGEATLPDAVQRDARSAQLGSQLRAVRHRLAAAEAELELLRNSRSMRYTAPLRRIARRMQRARTHRDRAT